MAHKVQITFDEATGDLRVHVAVYTAAGDKSPVARVGFDLTTAPVEPPKRRDGEADDAYAARCAKHLPAAIEVPAEYFAGLKERCEGIIAGVSEITAHHGQRAALEHALLAEGKAPAGVKQLKAGGALGTVGGTIPKKA